jgi:hypothetical protein
MTVFRTPTRFSFFKQIFFFCPHFAESANNVENAQYRRNFFAKNFRQY